MSNRIVTLGGVALAALCISLAVARAQAIAPMPPSAVYVPGNAAAFEQGLKAFDTKDYATAYRIFSDLAAQNDLAAMRNVALMRRKGLGTPKDPQGAIAMYTKAAEDGLPTAAADLGEMLLEGEAGPPDPRAALPWLALAAGAGHPVSQYLLGEMYARGYGVEQDLARAKEYYAAAAPRLAAAQARLDALGSGRPAPSDAGHPASSWQPVPTDAHP